jgi:hypothetical protein
VSDRRDFEVELRAVARNVYVVNEKRPPSYDRKWRLHVLWHDGTTTTIWGDDSERGFESVHREALRHPNAQRGDA